MIEGPKAGGHLGFSETELKEMDHLVYENEIKRIIATVKSYGVKYEKEIPVVVAGGIFDGKDVRHAICDLGADGVQVGTRFVTTEECDTPISYKEQYLKAQKEDIMITKSPVGMPGRAIRNAFLEAGKIPGQFVEKCYQCLEKCNPAEIPYCITKALVNAVSDRVDHALLFCGSNAYRCQKIETVEDVIKDLFPL